MTPRSSSALPLALALALAATAGLSACSSETAQKPLSREELMDPETCRTCHPEQYREWARSMHAYAGEDPVFIAMNARGQRETQGALGTFCVECHAPIAVRTGATRDGLDLASLAPKLRGVTCYFCHSVERIEAPHNGTGLVLATDDVLRGPISDPLATPAHGSAYSPLHDRERLDSSTLCGSCHDIVTPMGAPLERTHQEWQGSIFAQPTVNLSCAKCHMEGRAGLAAQVDGAPMREIHGHSVPGVHTALTPFVEEDALKAEVQRALDGTLQAEVCVSVAPYNRIYVVLDNVGAGHSFPSGATQDRRAWVEIVAERGGRVVYQTGVLDPSKPIEAHDDPDQWLLRDCLFDAAGEEVHMFWEVASVTSNQLPAPVTTNGLDPRFYLTHVPQRFAVTSTETGAGLDTQPDRVTLRVRLQPLGRSVLESLVASGDLDPAIIERVPIFDLGGTKLEWTREKAFPSRTDEGEQLLCVLTGLNAPIDTSRLAKSHTRCARE